MRPEDVELEPEVVAMLRRLPSSVALRVIDRLVARAAELDREAVNATGALAVQPCEVGPQQPSATETTAPDTAPIINHGRPRRQIDTAELVRLRKDGLSWPSIASRMHLGLGTVNRAYRKAIDAPQPFQNLSNTIPGDGPRDRTVGDRR